MSYNATVTASPNTLNLAPNLPPLVPYVSIASCNTLSPLSTSVTECIETLNYATANISRQLNSILLILFRNHPNGVFESDLALIYHQTFGEILILNQDMQYFLQTHQAICCTTDQTRGVLYKLDPHQITAVLKSFDPLIIKPYVAEHVLKLFNYFPNGIACIYLEDTLQMISQFRLSDVIPFWISFVTSIPFIIQCNVEGITVFRNIFQPLTSLKNSAVCNANACSICTETTNIDNISPTAAHAAQSPTNERSPFFEDHCSVFMGGFKHGTTTDDITSILSNLGLKVISCSDVKYRKYGFSWVTLSSSKEADYLIQISPIQLLGANIDVRPFINREKQQLNKPNDAYLLQTMIELVSNNKHGNNGLSIREMQPILYRSLAYRISGTDLVEIIKKNSEILCIQRDENGCEKIFSVV